MEKQLEEINTQQLVLSEVDKLPLVSKKQKRIILKKGEDPLNNLDTENYFYFVMDGKIKIWICQ